MSDKEERDNSAAPYGANRYLSRELMRASIVNTARSMVSPQSSVMAHRACSVSIVMRPACAKKRITWSLRDKGLAE